MNLRDAFERRIATAAGTDAEHLVNTAVALIGSGLTEGDTEPMLKRTSTTIALETPRDRHRDRRTVRLAAAAVAVAVAAAVAGSAALANSRDHAGAHVTSAAPMPPQPGTTTSGPASTIAPAIASAPRPSPSPDAIDGYPVVSDEWRGAPFHGSIRRSDVGEAGTLAGGWHGVISPAGSEEDESDDVVVSMWAAGTPLEGDADRDPSVHESKVATNSRLMWATHHGVVDVMGPDVDLLYQLRSVIDATADGFTVHGTAFTTTVVATFVDAAGGGTDEAASLSEGLSWHGSIGARAMDGGIDTAIAVAVFPVGHVTEGTPLRVANIKETVAGMLTVLSWDAPDGRVFTLHGSDRDAMYEVVGHLVPSDPTTGRPYTISGTLPGGLVELEPPAEQRARVTPQLENAEGIEISVRDLPAIAELVLAGATDSIEPVAIGDKRGFLSNASTPTLTLAIAADETLVITRPDATAAQLEQIAGALSVADRQTFEQRYGVDAAS